MMGDSERNQEETRVLRWGGLAGVLGSIIFIVVFAVVTVFSLILFNLDVGWRLYSLSRVPEQRLITQPIRQ
jgi:hypothetical protein